MKRKKNCDLSLLSVIERKQKEMKKLRNTLRNRKFLNFIFNVKRSHINIVP